MPVSILLAALLLQSPKPPASGNAGELRIFPEKGPETLCALKGTKVDADIQGIGARVRVVQTFKNPSDSPVEAVYTFPLPHDAAVDRMRIQVGNRVIEGELKKRDEARAIYTAAKRAGQTAALLDQERDNVFTQSIANLAPGAEVRVEISYVQLLKYEDGQFEFSFPMTVGPRYLGATTLEPDKISPPTLPSGLRSGATIDVKVDLDAGAPIQSLTSVLHKVDVRRVGGNQATVRLAKRDEIPNRDFILRYGVAKDTFQGAFLTHYEPERGGYFSLVLMPPKAPEASEIAPKELIFVMDQSGSQNGFPIEKSKELTLKLLDRMRPNDTFNVMGFSNDVNRLWPTPKPNTAANRAEAAAFVKKLEANGGTELQKAVVAALSPNADPRRLRYVVFNTDGFVGQDREILDNVRKYRRDTRMFVFGIGNGVNRDLVESMATEGRGDAEIVTLAESADGAVERFVRKSGNPVLTDVQVTAPEGTELTPTTIPDVLTDKPIVVFGRYDKPGLGRIEISGTMAGKPWHQSMPVTLPSSNDDATAVMSLWAKRRVGDLERAAYMAGLRETSTDGPRQQALRVALEHGIMSSQTSFVAVEKRVVNVGGVQRTVRVPIDMTDGVNASYPDGLYRVQKSRALAGGVGGGGFFGGSGRNRSAAPAAPLSVAGAALRETRAGSKVDPKLLKKKGSVAVQIGLTDLTPATLEKLEELGFTKLGSIEDLKVVLGKIDAAKLAKLEALAEVVSVLPDDGN